MPSAVASQPASVNAGSSKTPATRNENLRSVLPRPYLLSLGGRTLSVDADGRFDTTNVSWPKESILKYVGRDISNVPWVKMKNLLAEIFDHSPVRHVITSSKCLLVFQRPVSDEELRRVGACISRLNGSQVTWTKPYGDEEKAYRKDWVASAVKRTSSLVFSGVPTSKYLVNNDIELEMQMYGAACENLYEERAIVRDTEVIDALELLDIRLAVQELTGHRGKAAVYKELLDRARPKPHH
ncbi:hypothetical protein BOTBODRAFT_66113 [Botryobasidium botryosum FD-172 SS1]|uniref:Uncharacterized protein n=1 Tax=Botryobasidium botryosum (strain FD-172 SS1) TaxID=930990 RepID=A0A067MG76_BOTB1|nr:hypothetical protein BOTBODRAFT_66113 [Botryobasidium botryosum FD-172 SS1]